MASRVNVWGACRGLAVRARPLVPQQQMVLQAVLQKRLLSDDGDRIPGDSPVDPRSGQLSAVDGLESMNQGSLKKRIPTEPPANSTTSPSGFVNIPGGLTEEQAEVLYHEGRIPTASQAPEALQALQTKEPEEKADYKFPLPELPLPPNSALKERYHPVLHQFVRLLMKDGKLSRAQRQLAAVLNILRTSPPPILSPRYPLMPGAPPPSHLPLNPVLYLTVAIDSVSPLIKIRHLAGAAGGGQALDIPFPMEVRQRRRAAFKWIIDVVDKKPSRGSGRLDFPTRLAEEIVAVVEGRSSVWEKRQMVHKSGTVARANLNTFHGGKKGHRIIV